jgi:beta-galactosidase/beta-glucuronidase
MDLAYPRPQLVRENWKSLDGTWSYTFAGERDPASVVWQGEIQVPYPPESPLSGVHDPGFHDQIWYRRTFTVPESWRGQRVLLHFGAVDYSASVWVNGRLAATHEGGHTPFSADITDALQAGEQEVIVRAADKPLGMDKPRGKQDWRPEPHGIWYPRTTGIWQPVWLEPVPNAHIAKARFTPELSEFALRTEVELAGDTEGLTLEISLRLNGTLLTSDLYRLTEPRVERLIHLPKPAFDDVLAYLWSPERPNLIDVELKLTADKTVIDEVHSYTAMRRVEAKDGKFWLNTRPYFLRLALDQGYWDESLLAAPSGEALKKDVELAKAMGFNGVRKHQKIEDPRYLYWADKLGLLVWEEMPSAYEFSPKAIGRLTREWLEVVERDYNHPCIVAWVCFNESWGTPDLQHSEQQRHYIEALYHLTKSLDASRPVVGNDGWEHVATDLLTIHDYSREPATLERRYGTPEDSLETSHQVLEHGRAITLDSFDPGDQPPILSEFGGIRYNPEQEGWGYQEAESPEALLATYRELVAAASGAGLAGFCYTQFADTFQEQNGLLYSDRRPKVTLEALAEATRGGG